MPTASQKLERLTGISQSNYTAYHEDWFNNAIRAVFTLLKAAEGSVLDRFKRTNDITTGSTFNTTDNEVIDIKATYITTSAVCPVSIISFQRARGANEYSIFHDSKIPYAYYDGVTLTFSIAANSMVGPITRYTITTLSLPSYASTDIMVDLIPELIDPVSHYAAYQFYMFRCGEFQEQMDDRTQDEDSELVNLCMANINSSLQSAHEMFSLFTNEIKNLGGNVATISNWRKDGK